MLIALNPAVAGLALAVFVLANIITGYVSIGSLLAGLSIPFLFIRFFGETHLSILIFSFWWRFWFWLRIARILND